MMPFLMIMLVDLDNDTGVDNHDDDYNHDDDNYDDDNKNSDYLFALVLPDSPPNIIGLSSAHSPGSFLRFNFLDALASLAFKLSVSHSPSK